jgi:hypothetical protein
MFFAGKPCSFNTIEGVTGTHRAFQSRTKEQGRGGVAESPGIQKARPEETSGIEKAYFAGGGGSARMSSLVLRYFERET